jgi:hypothetical protein
MPAFSRFQKHCGLGQWAAMHGIRIPTGSILSLGKMLGYDLRRGSDEAGCMGSNDAQPTNDRRSTVSLRQR